MARITPYTRAPYPTIEGNDRVYFDNEFRKIQDCIRAIIENLKSYFDFGNLTIAGGVGTLDGQSPVLISLVSFDTEGAGATDDLNTITWAAAGEGQILIVYAVNDARTVVVKDGTGNLVLAGDMTLDNSADTITLQHFGGNYFELARSNNAA